MPKVYNKYKKDAPENAVFIGRGSPFGNPFKIGEDGDRATVINKYCDYLKENHWLIRKIKEELKGKDLVCFCSPSICHGDIILSLANNLPVVRPIVAKGLF